MNLQSEKTRETLNVTWAGKYSEHPRSFQSLEICFLLTFPFIERGYRKIAFRPGEQVSGYANFPELTRNRWVG
jgi:hypothetical protein